jgi:hypothetical protein
MGNSPEICRRHYAALIPEQMVDTAEFKKSALAKPMGDPELKVMIKRLLEKLDGDGICDSMHYTPEGIRANGTFSR